MTVHLTNADLVELTNWRRQLHQFPEISGDERATAARVVEQLCGADPDNIVTDLGGHGVAGIWQGAHHGPSVMVRCELDALPIHETNPDLPHQSQYAGRGHLCGHDGHMAIIAGVAKWAARNRDKIGRLVVLFQPAEETGAGAAAVIADPRFADLRCDYALSLHNYPGIAIGQAAIQCGIMNCASRGLQITLQGKTAHASLPETGLSPAPAIGELIAAVGAFDTTTDVTDPDFARVTLTHIQLGEPAFGIAPGTAQIYLTLRTGHDYTMAHLSERVMDIAQSCAAKHGLAIDLATHDIFHHCDNHPEATAILRRAMAQTGLGQADFPLPMRASEDFGRFGAHSKSAMVLLGAGVAQPELHHPDYDFPDDLIAMGVDLFIGALGQVWTTSAPTG